MALHYYDINKGAYPSSATRGSSASYAYSKDYQVTWDSTEITTKQQLVSHLELILAYISQNVVQNGTFNAQPNGYRVSKGGDVSDVNYRNHASEDTNSILDTDGDVAVEWSTSANYFSNDIVEGVENIKEAVMQNTFPIA